MAGASWSMAFLVQVRLDSAADCLQSGVREAFAMSSIITYLISLGLLLSAGAQGGGVRFIGTDLTGMSLQSRPWNMRRRV
jgi:hypothetical protein